MLHSRGLTASSCAAKVFVIPYGARAYRTYRGVRRVKLGGAPPGQAGGIAMVEDLRCALAAICGWSPVYRHVHTISYTSARCLLRLEARAGV